MKLLQRTFSAGIAVGALIVSGCSKYEEHITPAMNAVAKVAADTQVSSDQFLNDVAAADAALGDFQSKESDSLGKKDSAFDLDMALKCFRLSRPDPGFEMLADPNKEIQQYSEGLDYLAKARKALASGN